VVTWGQICEPEEVPENQKLKMKNITEAIVMPVEITVSRGKCQGKYHHIGQKFTVDGQTHSGMCIGAWDAISPYVVTLLYGGNFPWENEKCQRRRENVINAAV